MQHYVLRHDDRSHNCCELPLSREAREDSKHQVLHVRIYSDKVQEGAKPQDSNHQQKDSLEDLLAQLLHLEDSEHYQNDHWNGEIIREPKQNLESNHCPENLLDVCRNEGHLQIEPYYNFRPLRVVQSDQLSNVSVRVAAYVDHQFLNQIQNRVGYQDRPKGVVLKGLSSLNVS